MILAPIVCTIPPLGDGLILKYNPSIDFFTDMTKEKYYVYKSDINDNWLFQSFDMATDFAKYCNHINKKHLHRFFVIINL